MNVIHFIPLISFILILCEIWDLKYLGHENNLRMMKNLVFCLFLKRIKILMHGSALAQITLESLHSDRNERR